jgi:hypothetical protein
MIRSAIRQVLKVAPADVESAIRTKLTRDDDYQAAGKPACAWDDAEERARLVNDLVRDANQTLHIVQTHDGAAPSAELVAAITLLATVVGQDIETAHDRFVIRQGVAENRIISTVDPDTRHGRKTSARGFDGYKGHISVDPDSEIIMATTVSAGNVSDGAAAEPLLQQALEPSLTSVNGDAPPAEIFGDCAYGTAEIVDKIEAAGARPMVRMQPPAGRDGQFTKADFIIDLEANTVICPAGQLVQIRKNKSGEYAEVKFAAACANCPLAAKCTAAKLGRTIHLHPREQTLQRHRAAQTPQWLEYYRANRPKVERKIAHLMRRKHGGRLCRVRGRRRVAADFALLAAGVNLNRLAVKGLTMHQSRWAVR